MPSDKTTIELTCLHDTEVLACKLAKNLTQGCTIYLSGNLGAGKTTLVQGILSALGHKGASKSPTYTLVESYTLAIGEFFHFDLYRLNDPSELEYIGIRDYLTDEAICVFEWAEKGRGFLPPPDLTIEFQTSHAQRQAIISAQSARGTKILSGLSNNVDCHK